MTGPAGADTQAGATTTGEPGRFWPGQPDMWAFVVFEAFLFTAYFTVYVLCRVQSLDLYLASQAQLAPWIGTLNTLLLLASSWSGARCVGAARAGSYRAALTSSYLTVFFGVAFLVSKVLEWRAEIGQGFTFTTNEFFSFYYFLTALHFLHVLIGFVFLGVVVRELRDVRRRSQTLIETGATYWHTVDFLWVMIFSLLYVMR